MEVGVDYVGKECSNLLVCKRDWSVVDAEPVLRHRYLLDVARWGRGNPEVEDAFNYGRWRAEKLQNKGGFDCGRSGPVLSTAEGTQRFGSEILRVL